MTEFMTEHVPEMCMVSPVLPYAMSEHHSHYYNTACGNEEGVHVINKCDYCKLGFNTTAELAQHWQK